MLDADVDEVDVDGDELDVDGDELVDGDDVADWNSFLPWGKKETSHWNLSRIDETMTLETLPLM